MIPVVRKSASPRRFKNAFIHPTAEIEKDVRIGAGTRIWHFVHIRKGARIGRRCSIGRNVYVDVNVRVGNGVKIQNGVSVYEGVTLADDVFVGPNVTFTNDRYPRSFPNGWKKIPTRVRRGASLGANVTVLCGVTIGRYAMIAAGSVVSDDVAPHILLRGAAATIVGSVSKAGIPVRKFKGYRRSHQQRRRRSQ